MTEAFLQYVWRFGLFDNQGLTTLDGDPVEIVDLGELNYDAGPDFFNARIRIGETLWAGNIELHLKTSDWQRHNHQANPAYNNVVLHVVGESDGTAVTHSGRSLPEIVLLPRIRSDVAANYQEMQRSNQWVACQPRIKEVAPILIDNWVTRLVIERLQRKSQGLLETLEHTQQDWAETFYQALARNFGFKTNAEPFEQLSRILPFRHLARHRDQRIQVEALLFGQAGFLEEDLEEEHYLELQREYRHLRRKLNLQPMEKSTWKFARLRPSNFPTVRLAQFAQVVFNWDVLFSKVLEAPGQQELTRLFQVEAGEYWQTHYTFGKPVRKRPKRLGEAAVQNILVNTVAPFLFIYGRQRGVEELENRSLDLLEGLPPEDNSIIRKWQEIGIGAGTAFRTQGLLELKNEYCNRKNCVNCTIGNRLLQSPNDQ